MWEAQQLPSFQALCFSLSKHHHLLTIATPSKREHQLPTYYTQSYQHHCSLGLQGLGSYCQTLTMPWQSGTSILPTLHKHPRYVSPWIEDRPWVWWSVTTSPTRPQCGSLPNLMAMLYQNKHYSHMMVLRVMLHLSWPWSYWASRRHPDCFHMPILGMLLYLALQTLGIRAWIVQQQPTQYVLPLLHTI